MRAVEAAACAGGSDEAAIRHDGRFVPRRAVARGDQGTCTWITWTPTEVGDFTLHAELDEERDDDRLTNNLVELAVQVVGD